MKYDSFKNLPRTGTNILYDHLVFYMTKSRCVPNLITILCEDETANTPDEWSFSLTLRKVKNYAFTILTISSSSSDNESGSSIVISNE